MSRRRPVYPPPMKTALPTHSGHPPIRFAEDERKRTNGKGTAGRAVAVAAGKGKAAIRRTSSSKASGGVFSWVIRTLFRLATYYTLFCALFTCGSGPFRFDYSVKDERSVCRSLAYGKEQLVPLVTPVLQSVHDRIDPYVGPYVRAVTPYAKTVHKYSKPHIQRADKISRALYNKHVEPARKHAVKKGRDMADPHVKKVRAQYKKQVQPHVDTVHRSLQPYRDIYHRDVSPYVQNAQEQAVAAAYASHKAYVHHVHPHLMTLLAKVHSFFVNHLGPAMQRAYILYIQPQVDRITLRLFGYVKDRTVKVAQPVPSRAQQSATSIVDQVSSKVVPTGVKETVASVVEKATGAVSPSGAKESVISVVERARSAVAPSDVQESIYSAADEVSSTAASVASSASSFVSTQSEQVVETAQAAAEKVLGTSADEAETAMVNEDGENIAELDQQLDSELERVTQELESWERDLGRIMADEMKGHSQRVQRGSLDRSELEQARNASVAMARRYLRKAQKAFLTAMEAAKFEQTVSDFEGWDKGLGVRVKLFAEDLVELEQQAKPVVVSPPVEKEAAPAPAEAVVEAESAPIAEATEENESAPAPASASADEEQPIAALADDELSGQGQSFPDRSTEGDAPAEPAPVEKLETEPSQEDAVPAETGEKEPTFSILPIEVADDKGTPLEESQVDAAEAIEQPTDSVLPVNEEGQAVVEDATPQETADEPTYSILPIESNPDKEDVGTLRTPPTVTDDEDETSFSILPIDVVDEKPVEVVEDDKVTPAQVEEPELQPIKIQHEEL